MDSLNSPADIDSVSRERRERPDAGLNRSGRTTAAGIGRADRNADPPLSSSQQWLWFLQQSDPASSAYNSPMAFRLRGRVDVNALRWSFDRILERHEALRTRFVLRDGAPAAVIAAPYSVPFRQIALKVPAEDPGLLERAVSDDARRCFDLAHDCLIRASLFTVADQEHVLLIVTHHAASDGWSHRILVEELSDLYSSRIRGTDSRLPAPSLQYRDFAAWQQQRLRSRAAGDLAYWKRQLDGAPPLLELPTDHPRPARESFEGATHRFVVPPSEVDPIKSLARSAGATPFMALLAGFAIVLSRWTHRADLIIGSPSAMRSRREIEPLIGCFINTLALRLDLSGGPSFVELLRRIRRTTIEGMTHGDVPFDWVVQQAALERSTSYSPLVQTMFAMQNAHRRGLSLEGLSVDPFVIESGISKLDLTLDVTDGPRGLDCALEFKTDLFRVQTIERLAGHWRTVMGGAVAAPDRSIDDVPLLSPGELTEIRSWNQTDVAFDPSATLHGLIEAQVERNPDATAIICAHETISYRELDARANQYARALSSQRLDPGTVAGVFMDRSIDTAAVLLAILKCGAAYLPLDPSWPDQRLAQVLAEAAPGLIITRSDLAGRLPDDGRGHVDADLIRAHGVGQSCEPVTRVVEQNDLAYLLFTSGSTGIPKGVMMPHGPVCNHIEWLQSAYPVLPSDRVLCHTSFGFDVSVGELFGTLAAGATVVMAEPGREREPRYLAKLIAERDISVIDVVPSMLRALIDERAFEACRSLRQVRCGAEPMPADLARTFCEMSDAALINFYGPTESCIDVTAWRCSRGAIDGNVPIGYPIANAQIHILDPRGRRVPVGVPGEIHVGGAVLARGYLGRPDLTNESFVEREIDPARPVRLYRTGDWARYRADGAIEFLGRRDRQVKVRGVRVELEDVEAAMRRIPGVRECAVVARHESDGSTRLVGYAACEDVSLDASRIRERLLKAVPGPFVPDLIVVLAELPRTRNGKVDVAALPSPSVAREDPSDERPRNEIESAVAVVFSEVLKVPCAGRHQNFFAAGGHSLLAAQLMSRLRDELNVDLPLRTLFDSPTVASLAASVIEYVDGKDRDSVARMPPLVVPLRPTGRRAPFFFLHAAVAGDAFYARQIAGYLSAEQPFYSLAPIGVDGEPIPSCLEEVAKKYVRIIRELRPTGPYILGGFCMSGPVALEIAQQLVQAGESVPLVVVIDSVLRNTSALHRLCGRTVQALCALAGVPDSRRVDLLWLLKRIHGNATIPPSIDATSSIRRRIEKHYDRIRMVYVPRVTDIPIVSFWARESGLEHPGWQTVSRRSSSEVIPGNHLTCVTVHLRALAAALENRLASANAA